MKTRALSIIAAGVLIGGAIMLIGGSSGTSGPLGSAHNVSVVDGRQVIALAVKGGYSPPISHAKADMPTVLRLETSSTFDCSSAITIPAIGYRENLPASGVTQVNVPPQKAGTTLQGLCAMGMKSFQISFN